MRSRVVGPYLAVLALASACATSTGSIAGSRFEAGPAPARPRTITRAETDSILAQTIADRDGPRVDVRARVTQVTSSRRLRAVFSVQDDAYVVIGHVDPEGVVRIVFPNDPKDDGFVRGGSRSYETNEFFGGFTDQYRYRFQQYRNARYTPDSYDGGLGYVFIVASWRPMHVEQFVGPNGWDSFEMTSNDYMSDPRPAIYELAALLAGDNREAYTVKFAKYYNTQNYSVASYGSSTMLGYGLCRSGFGSSQYYGFPSSPFDSPMSMINYGTGFGYDSNIYYRGRTYMYDAAGGCFNVMPLGGYGYYYNNPRIANTPIVPGVPTPSRPRVLSAENTNRQPLEPQPIGGKVAPVTPKDMGPVGDENGRRVSPTYRQRGLITEDDPGVRIPGRSPRVDVAQDRTRPSIQQMVERRARDMNEGNNWTRPQARVNGNDGAQSYSRPANSQPRTRSPEYGSNRGGDYNGGTGSRMSPSDGPRSNPQPVESTPRMSAPERSSPPPVAAPRVSVPPPAPTSTPPSETRPIVP